VASFIGNPPMNFMDVEVSGTDGEFTAQTENFTLKLTSQRGEKAVAHPGNVIMGIRPEDITISPDGELGGEVYVVEPMGREDLLDVRVGKHSFIVLAGADVDHKPGDQVRLTFNMEKAQFFDPQTEKSLLWS
jgi:ABC-type sugar transport system ATPase subunit